MKLHATLVEKLLHLFETYGGHKNESKLRSMLQQLDLSEYERQSGEKILVLTEQLEQERDQLLPRR